MTFDVAALAKTVPRTLTMGHFVMAVCSRLPRRHWSPTTWISQSNQTKPLMATV